MALLLICAAVGVRGERAVYVGGGDGMWENVSVWDLGRLPCPFDDVVLPKSHRAYTVALHSNVTVQSLLFDGDGSAENRSASLNFARPHTSAVVGNLFLNMFHSEGVFADRLACRMTVTKGFFAPPVSSPRISGLEIDILGMSFRRSPTPLPTSFIFKAPRNLYC